MEFTEDFVSGHAADWSRLLGYMAGRPQLRFLEVGSLEGRSALWWLNNILTDASSTLICVDLWGPRDAANELRFDANIRESRRGGQVRKLKADSRRALGRLPADHFDFAYVDGSHNACDALADALLILPLLKPGGILLFDDYEWDVPEFYDDLPPRPGIDAFLSVCAARVEVLTRGYQVAVRKKAFPT